jgi:hypothetical protein
VAGEGVMILDDLAESKGRFSAGMAQLLEHAAKQEFTDAASLIRLHEILLFVRAYPASARIAKLADSILFSFARRVTALWATGADLTPFAEPEVSGIAGTSFSAVFSYEAARSLSARHQLDINWDAFEPDKLGSVLRRFVPLLDEDWPVEANVPYREWIRAAKDPDQPELQWLLQKLDGLPVSEREKSELYEKLQLPLQWDLNDSAATRSRVRLEPSKLFIQKTPLLRRGDVSLGRELAAPPLPAARVPKREAETILGLIVDTSATRYRELYGFNHPDTANVYRAQAGRGLEIVFFGIPREWRLPLRAYHSGMFFKNGVPAGYIETLSLFERAEVGFNLYYTFREGEAAWIYARLLRFLRQMLGETCFSVDPYQLGHENKEAAESGAFWFYRKLGFRPLNPHIAKLVAREERKMQADPRHRSGKETLKKLAAGYVLYGGGSEWDRFSVRNLGFAAQRTGCPLRFLPELAQWTALEKRKLDAIVEAKVGREESRYLLLMQEHKRLRDAFIRLGSCD